MKTALFLVDASASTGLGHLRRTEVLLSQMVKEDFACSLYCQDPAVARSIGLSAHELPTNARILPACDVIVCDSYLLSPVQIAEFRERSKVLLVFDDLGNKALSADIVLNHNLYGDTVDYSFVTCSIVLAGSRFTLVRPEVLKAATAYATRTHSNDVVVSFGGTDDGTLSSPVVDSLLNVGTSRINVVIAPGINPCPAIKSIESREREIVTIHQNPNLPELLSTCRLYVGAAGMTATEAHIIGLDMILCVIADNQRLNAQAFANLGHAVMDGINLQLLSREASRILSHKTAHQQSSVDGLGAQRVAEVIVRVLAGR